MVDAHTHHMIPLPQGHPGLRICVWNLLLIDEYLQYTPELVLSSDESRYVSAIATQRKDKLTPEELARLWHIGILTARRTLQSTTHQCLCTAGNLSRRFRTDRAHMRYKRLSSAQGKFYVDTLKAKVKYD